MKARLLKKIKTVSLLNENNRHQSSVMIIVVDTEGQLCNRLWGFLPLLQHHHLTGERVVVLFFEAYSAHFPCFSDSRGFRRLRLLPKGVVYGQVIKVIKRLFKNGRFTYKNTLEQHKRGCSLVIAWDHRLEPHDEHTRQLAVRLFRPSDAVVKRVEGLLEGYRSKGTILLGVHLRKRDYRYFHDGRFYYSDAEYLTFIRQISQQVESMGYTLRCLLCSDEPIDLSAFQGVEAFSIPQSESMEDLYGLSCCDLIVGPPSTFSQWASYFGRVPLKLVWDKTAFLEVAEFGICTNLDQTKPVEMTNWLRERSLLGDAPQVES